MRDQWKSRTIDYPYISKPLLLVFCGYVFIWYLQVGVRIPALGAIRFEFIYAAVLTALALFVTPKIDSTCPLIPYIVLYFLVIAIQVPFSYDFDVSWEIFTERIIKLAFMSFFIVAFVRSPTHLKFFLAAFLLACMKMGEEGLIGKITGGMVWENQGIMRLNGPTPNYSHPNSFSGMALGTMPFVFYLWPVSNKYIRLVLFIIALLSLNIVVYSGSRTGYVGAFAFLFYYLLNSKNKRKVLVAYLLMFIISVQLLPDDYIGRFTSIYTGKDKEGHSTEARKEILSDAWQIFKDHPLGIGVSAFPKIRRDTFGRSQDTHNLYFEIATNLGVQGLIVVGLLIYQMIAMLNNIRLAASKMIVRLKDNSQNNSSIISDLRFIEAVSMATIAFLAIRLTLGFFGMDLYEIYWWFALGITVSMYSILERIKVSLGQPNL